MRTDAFDFDLPRDRIALHPASPRDASRLLEVGACPVDHNACDLPNLLRPHDILVFNDTRVIPARLIGRRGQAGIEATLHKRLDAATWRAFARPAKRLRPGDTVVFGEGFTAEVLARHDGGEVDLRFDRGGDALKAALELHGSMPLPPYIRRDDGAETQDRHDYQTVFAARDGAVAAPTAGLHFTPGLLDALAQKGVTRAAVTLHVGAGTFLPVKAEDTDDHRMHAEWGEISPKTVAAIAAARALGGRVVAVGTTSLRLLESAALEGALQPFAGDTSIFITPGFDFKVVDLLLTNFHLPRSTLFMLVSAFAGLERMRSAYAHAIESGYRFYSYGDWSLLHPEKP